MVLSSYYSYTVMYLKLTSQNDILAITLRPVICCINPKPILPNTNSLRFLRALQRDAVTLPVIFHSEAHGTS